MRLGLVALWIFPTEYDRSLHQGSISIPPKGCSRSESIFPFPKEALSSSASDVKWFAGLAMQAIIQKLETAPDSESEREEIALWAWRMGQAMVATEKRIHGKSSNS